MYSEAQLKEKHSTYVLMCENENIDPEKILDFQMYRKVYLEIAQSK